MNQFHHKILFRDGVDHGMYEAFALSNWHEGTWEVTGNLLQQNRDRAEELESRLQLTREIYGGNFSWIRIRRTPWPALVTGESTWTDYQTRATIRVTGDGTAGIGFRWQDARHCYYAMLENHSSLALYRREQDDVIELARADFPHDRERFYNLRAEGEADRLTCCVDDGPTISATDSSWPSGRVALVAGCPSQYHDLEAAGSRHPTPAPAHLPGTNPREEVSIPITPFDPENEQGPTLYEVNGEMAIVRRPSRGRELLFLDSQGGEFLRLGPWDSLNSLGNIPLQIFDINGDGRDEAVLVADQRIYVYSCDTGEQLASCDTPPPNEYGEALRVPDSATVDDSLCRVLAGTDELPFFYVKDRYWNIHLFNATLEHCWHKALNTGHCPLPIDLDGSGREQILCGHTLLDLDGNVVWKLDLEDHFDGAAYLTLAPDQEPHFYVAAGEEGLLCIDPATGEILSQQLLGHVQNCLFGRFLPDRAGLQVFVITCWREPGLRYLLDENLGEVARWERDPALYQLGDDLLPWGERDLIITQQGIRDPLNGLVIHEFPEETVHTHCVTDWPGVGPSRLMQVLSDRIVISGPEDGNVRYATPIRPIHCGYLPRGPLSWVR